MSFRFSLPMALLLAAGCAGHGANPPEATSAGSAAALSSHVKHRKTPKITHVIVMIQENRSFDNMFQGFQGANTQSYGLNHLGQQVPLKEVPIHQTFDPPHDHATFVTEADYNASSNAYKMDGFDLVAGCAGKPSCAKSVYTYVQQSDVANYWTYGQQYVLGDMTFQGNMGTSWTAHQYLIAGQGGGYQANHLSFYGDPAKNASCNPPLRKKTTLDMTVAYPGKTGAEQVVCVTYPTIFDELDAAGITWRYYARAKTGYWTAPANVQSLFQKDAANIIVPESNVLTDIQNHALPAVSYVTPADSFSDHPYPTLTNHGQDWLALIANGIGMDPYYWDNTVILVMWDDWGGYYDHVPPPWAFNPAGGNPDPNEYGMRVPFIVIGAYVTPHVDHTVRSNVAALTFIEKVFNLPSLGTLDAQQDDLMGLFNFSQPPIVYQQVTTHGWTPGAMREAAAHSGPIDSDMP